MISVEEEDCRLLYIVTTKKLPVFAALASTSFRSKPIDLTLAKDKDFPLEYLSFKDIRTDLFEARVRVTSNNNGFVHDDV
jgi:hypothetical protein